MDRYPLAGKSEAYRTAYLLQTAEVVLAMCEDSLSGNTTLLTNGFVVSEIQRALYLIRAERSN